MRRLIVFLALSGCSFAFVSGPPPNHAELAYFDCTTSRLAPVLDTVLAGLMTLNVLTLSATSDQTWAHNNNCAPGDASCPAISRNGAMALDAVLGVAGVAGLVYGFSKTGACRQAKAEQAARAPQQQPYGPGTWPPPGGYPPPGQPQGTWPPPQQPGPPQPQPQPAPQPQPQSQPQTVPPPQP